MFMAEFTVISQVSTKVTTSHGSGIAGSRDTVFLAILKFPSGVANAVQWVSKQEDQLQIFNIRVVVVALL